MKLSDFNFELPEHLIATRPARPRTASRLMVATPSQLLDQKFADLPGLLRAGDRLILNDTKVIPARLTGLRKRMSEGSYVQAKIQVTLLDPTDQGSWMALLKPLRKVNIGETITFAENFNAKVVAKMDGQAELKFNLTGDVFDAALQDCGAMPLPPYIQAKRPADGQDMQDYQTVWARHRGAVAAPTASLHFDDLLLEQLRQSGVKFTFVTLHVGAGTFLPVKVDDVRDHKMHSERGQISQTAADEINQTRAEGGRIIPVGTTALRLIETACDSLGRVAPWQGATDIFITPGYKFRAADALITNFHLPRSTLMMLVAAFMGHERIQDIYDKAVSDEYRFFSYGDSSLLLPGGI
ncbi:MAG: tRNA preQ1(34) S-adenosylmethionine ribosyltransferase-isomerase QueA [Paracoccaceae bacterium]